MMAPPTASHARAVGLIGAALAPTVFLTFDPAGWFPFGPAKWLFASTVVLLSFLILSFGGCLRLDASISRWWAGLLGVLAVAAAFGRDPLYAWIGTPERRMGWLTWLLFALAFVVGQSLDARARERFVSVGLVVAGLGVGGVAALEALGAAPEPLDIAGDRLGSTFGSAAFLGSAAALLTFCLVGLALDQGRSRAMRSAAGVGTVLCVVGLVGSGTRGAWLGMAIASGVVLWLRRGLLRGHRRTVVAWGAVGLVSIAALLALTPAGGRVADTFSGDRNGGAGRVDEWRVAGRVIARNPVLGAGPEGYRIAFASGADEAYARTHGRDPLPDRAHSAPLDAALVGGLPALVLWLGLLTAVGRPVLAVIRRGSPGEAGVAGGLVAVTVASLVLFPTMEIDLVAWFLAGTVVAASTRHGERRVVEWRVPEAASVVLGVLAVGAVVTGCLGVWADRQAENAVEALGRNDPAAAVRAARRARDLRPDVIRYDLLLARAHVADGQGHLVALDDLKAGARMSPDDPILRLATVRELVERARATLVPSHIAAADRSVQRLVVDDPTLADGWLLDGDVAVLRGHPTIAITAWERAESLSPRSAAAPARLAELLLSLDRRAEAERAAGRALELDGENRQALDVLKALQS